MNIYNQLAASNFIERAYFDAINNDCVLKLNRQQNNMLVDCLNSGAIEDEGMIEDYDNYRTDRVGGFFEWFIC